MKPVYEPHAAAMEATITGFLMPAGRKRMATKTLFFLAAARPPQGTFQRLSACCQQQRSVIVAGLSTGA